MSPDEILMDAEERMEKAIAKLKNVYCCELSVDDSHRLQESNL